LRLATSSGWTSIDWQRTTNADMFRAYLQRLKSSGSGLVCCNERWQDGISCYTRRFFLLLPGDRSFLLRQLAAKNPLLSSIIISTIKTLF